MDLEAWCAQGTAKGGAKGPRGMVGPRGAAPLMMHWCKYTYSGVEIKFSTPENAAKFSFIIILLFYKKYLIDIFLLIEIYLPIVSILAVDRISSIIH